MLHFHFIYILFIISSEEVDRLAHECRMRLYRTSVKEDINVGGLFQHLAENYVNKLRSSPPPTSTSSSSYDSSVDSGLGGHSDMPRPIRDCNGPMSLQIQIGGHVRTPPTLRTSIGSTGSGSSGHSSISHFSSISPQEYLANPMFDSLNEHQRRHRRLYWPSHDKTISLKPLVVKRTRSLQRKLPPMKSGCRVI